MLKNKKGVEQGVWIIITVIFAFLILGGFLARNADIQDIVSSITDRFNPNNEYVDLDSDKIIGLDDCDCDLNKGMGEPCENNARCDQLIEINKDFKGYLRGPWTEDLVKQFFQCTPYTLFTKEAKKDERIKEVAQLWSRISEKAKEPDNAACKRMRLFFDDQISAVDGATGTKSRCQDTGRSCVKSEDIGYYYVCVEGTTVTGLEGCLGSETCCERMTMQELLKKFDDNLRECASDFDACEQASALLAKMQEIGTFTMNFDTQKILLTTKKKVNDKTYQANTEFNSMDLIEISSDSSSSTSYQGNAARGTSFMRYLGDKKFEIVTKPDVNLGVQSTTMTGELQLIRPTGGGKSVEFAFGKLTEK